MIELKTYIAYMSDLLNETDSQQVEQFLQAPHNKEAATQLKREWRAWHIKQFNKEANALLAGRAAIEEKYDRVLRWLLKEATAEEVSQAKQDIEKDDDLYRFYADAQRLSLAIHSAEFPSWNEAVAEVKRDQQQALPIQITQFTPAPGWRDDNEDGGGIELEIPVPPEYNFVLSLFLENTADIYDRVDGEAVLKNGKKASHMSGAIVWLLPESELATEGWTEGVKEANVSNTGNFTFHDVPAGLYRLEISWSEGRFYEHPNIELPK